MVSACSMDEDFSFPAGGRLTFSADTVSFDTVFTTIGSSTKRITVFNTNDKAVRLPLVRLASGGRSGFRMNLDGQSGTSFQDIEINHKDSIFAFIEVTVNPNDADSPLLISDSILFRLPDGAEQKVILQAYGQDVIILRGEHVSEDMTLDAQKPYLIYDSLVVDSGKVLTIDPGVTMCFHYGAELLVRGNIVARGTLDSPITFRGDRTDRLFSYLPYDRTDAQWGGIHIFNLSNNSDNIFSFCDIHGGDYGIKIDTYQGPGEPNTLRILSSSIHNVHGHGLDMKYCLAYISNSQITNAFGNCVNMIGGKAQFNYTTIAQFYPWDSSRGHALYFANVEDSLVYPLHELVFTNCIITGYDKDEMYGTRYTPEDGGEDVDFNYDFKYTLILTDTAGIEETHYTKCVFDVDTAFNRTKNFRNIDTKNYIYDFSLDSISKARGIGINIPGVQTDKKGTARPAADTDAGCFQYQ